MDDKMPFDSYVKSEYIISDTKVKTAPFETVKDKKTDVSLIIISVLSVLAIVVCAMYLSFILDTPKADYNISGTNISGYTESGKNEVIEGKININTANLSALCTLKGIGESKALDIISYRNEHGKFKSIDEIKNVSGIKDATFEKIKDYICI